MLTFAAGMDQYHVACDLPSIVAIPPLFAMLGIPLSDLLGFVSPELVLARLDLASPLVEPLPLCHSNSQLSFDQILGQELGKKIA